MRDNISSIPAIIRTDRSFRRFLVDRIMNAGMFIMLPFLAIHALSVLGRDESYLGYFVQAQMAGGIVGNIAAGAMGDRRGGRVVLLTSRVVLMVVCLWAGWNTSAWGFTAIFFLLAAGMHLANIGSVTLGFDLSPEGRVPTYLAIMHLAMLPGMLIAVGLSTAVREAGWPFPVACLLSLGSQAFSLAAVIRLREPRRRIVPA
jgi:MFS family permease